MKYPDGTLGSLDLHQGNVLILSLDKGFRSGSAADQIESLVRLPTILNQIPLPVLINSAFLKLADLFRGANNTVRAYIVNVCEKFILQDFAAKIINKSDFLQKIESVMYSNDPVARSLALRQLGVFSLIGREKVSCHHFVRNALDSFDQVEVEAALFAAKLYARRSPMFAAMILSKVQSLLDSITCCPDHVTHLLTILGNCGHELESSCKVVQVVLSYVNTYNTTPHLIHILNVASHTAISSRVMCKEVVDELLDLLEIQSSRLEVRKTCLGCLLKLAQRVPHAWTNDQSNNLLNFTIDQKSNSDLFGQSIRVLVCLPATCVFGHSTESPVTSSDPKGQESEQRSRSTVLVTRLMEVCEEYCFTKQTPTVIDALTFYVKYAEFDDFIPTFEYVIKQVMYYGGDCDVLNERCLQVLNQLLKIDQCSVAVYGRLSQVLATQLVESTRTSQITDHVTGKSIKLLLLSLKSLVDQCRIVHDQNPFNDKVQSGLAKISAQLTSALESIEVAGFPKELFPCLVTVFFSCKFSAQSNSDTSNWVQKIAEKSPNCWVAYKIARNLLCFGQFSPTDSILKELKDESYSLKSASWFKSLSFLCDAEKNLGSKEERNFELVLENYHSALRILSAMESKSVNKDFQSRFLQLRFEFLDVCKQLLDWTFWTQMLGGAELSADNLSIGPIIETLSCLWQQLKSLTLSYEELQRCFIDADPHSRFLLAELQGHSRMLAMAVHALFLPHIPTSTRLPEDHEIMEKRSLEAKIANKIISSKNLQPISKCDCLSEITEWVLAVPLKVPRFFLQSLRSTSVKLITSVTQGLTGEATTVFANENLTLKTEGVVAQRLTHSPQDKPRGLSVKKCRVCYQVNLVQAGRNINAKLGIEPAPSDISDMVIVDKKGYFFSTVLIKPPCAGKYEVNISLRLIESGSDTEWKHSLVESVLLKAIDKNIR